jgi:hypothetical protein
VEYLFRVGRINGAAITWSTLRGFRTDVTCPWIPSQGGQYVLEVQARELGTRTVVAVKRISYGVGP